MSHIPSHRPSAFDVNASRDPRRDKYEELGFLDYLLSDPIEFTKFATQAGLDATSFMDDIPRPMHTMLPGGAAPMSLPWTGRDLARAWVGGPTRDESPEEYAARSRLTENDARRARGEEFMKTPRGVRASKAAAATPPPPTPAEARWRAEEDYFNSPAFQERIDNEMLRREEAMGMQIAEGMSPRNRLERGAAINPMEAEMLLDEEVNAKYNQLHGPGMGQMIQNDPYLQRNLDPTGRSYPVSWAYDGADIDYKREAADTQARNQRVIDEQNAIRAEEIMTDLFGSKDQRDRDRELSNQTPAWQRDGYDSREEWGEDKRRQRREWREEENLDRDRRKTDRRAEKKRKEDKKKAKNAPPATVTTSSGTTTHGPSGQPVSNTGTGNPPPEGEGQKKKSSVRVRKKPLDEILNPHGQFDDAPWLTKNRNQTANQYLYG